MALSHLRFIYFSTPNIAYYRPKNGQRKEDRGGVWVVLWISIILILVSCIISLGFWMLSKWTVASLFILKQKTTERLLLCHSSRRALVYRQDKSEQSAYLCLTYSSELSFRDNTAVTAGFLLDLILVFTVLRIKIEIWSTCQMEIAFENLGEVILLVHLWFCGLVNWNLNTYLNV